MNGDPMAAESRVIYHGPAGRSVWEELELEPAAARPALEAPVPAAIAAGPDTPPAPGLEAPGARGAARGPA
jgi:hypothetical protein